MELFLAPYLFVGLVFATLKIISSNDAIEKLPWQKNEVCLILILVLAITFVILTVAWPFVIIYERYI